MCLDIMENSFSLVLYVIISGIPFLCPLLCNCIIGPEKNYLSLYRIKYPLNVVRGFHFKVLYVFNIHLVFTLRPA